MRALPISLLAVACSTAPPPPDGVPAALHDAHAAWIEGDLDALTAAVHDTLAVDPTPDVVHNAVSLLHTAFQEHPTLPTDQVLPPGVRRLSLDHVHRVGPDGHRYRLVVSALVDSEDRLDDLRVTGPGLEADRRTATWTVTPEEGATFVELELPDTPAPAPPGLYSLTLVSPTGEDALWTVLCEDSTSEVPTVTMPKSGAIVRTAMPTVHMDVAPTQEHTGGETVGHGVWIGSVPDYAMAWSTWSASPADTVTVDTPLADGRYWLAVSRREVHELGPVSLGRVARRGVPFEVWVE